MPAGIGISFVTQPLNLGTTFAAADTTVAKNILTAPGGYWRLIAINLTSDDTAAQVIDIFLRAGSTNFLLGSVSIPAGTGKAGVAPVEFFKAVMPDTEQGLDLSPTTSVQAAMEATITATKTVTVQVLYGLY